MIENHINFLCALRITLRDNNLTAEQKLDRIKDLDIRCAEEDVAIMLSRNVNPV